MSKGKGRLNDYWNFENNTLCAMGTFLKGKTDGGQKDH